MKRSDLPAALALAGALALAFVLSCGGGGSKAVQTGIGDPPSITSSGTAGSDGGGTTPGSDGGTNTSDGGLGFGSIQATVSGFGNVISSPAGLTCADSCLAEFTGGSTVTLGAAPLAGYVFAGWGGACTGTGTCLLVVPTDATLDVFATFTAQ